MLIGVVQDSDFGLEDKPLSNPETRVGARGIVILDNKIALFNKVAKNEYKLPGGGVEQGEDIEDAFKREIFEETGCEVEIITKLGEIVEQKSQENFKQTSHVFVSRVTKQTDSLHLTEKETIEGAKLLWVSVDDAIILVESCLDKLVASEFDSVYRTQFMVKRDALILECFKNYLDNL